MTSTPSRRLAGSFEASRTITRSGSVVSRSLAKTFRPMAPVGVVMTIMAISLASRLIKMKIHDGWHT